MKARFRSGIVKPVFANFAVNLLPSLIGNDTVRVSARPWPVLPGSFGVVCCVPVGAGFSTFALVFFSLT